MMAKPVLRTWTDWKLYYASQMRHPRDYEVKFVDKVLSQIPGISPSDVIPQYPFLGDQNKSYRIDFVIINPEKGYSLPIELDGLDKLPPGSGKLTQQERHEWWNAVLARQNEIIRAFGTLFRFSNSQMLNNPYYVISKIENQLLLQRKPNKLHEGADRTDPEPGSTPPGKDGGQQGIPYKPEPPTLGLPDLPAPINPRSQPSRRWIIAGIGLVAVAVLGYTVREIGMRDTAVAQVDPTFTPRRNIPSLSQAPAAPPQADAYAVDSIPAAKAHDYIGQRKRICGQVAGSKEFSTGLFVDFDRPYPNNVMTIVVWRQNLDKFGPLRFSDGQGLCVSGLIQIYRGKPQVEVEHLDQISQ